MKTAENFLIIGGDTRQNYIADSLEKKGKKVAVYGLPEITRMCVKDVKTAIKLCDAIVLPLPLTKDNKNIFSVVPIKESLDEILNFVPEGKLVFAGMLTKGAESKIKKNGAYPFDYFKREDVTIMNTVPTVQGILKVIIDNVDYTIHSSNCAVFGYGRVAKAATEVLSSIGADVTVCARKNSDLILGEIKGYNGCLISENTDIAMNFDIIINTVPARVIDRKILENVRQSCLIIDVASAPFGTDFATAFEFGIKAFQCPSLPGKVAPKTAGEIIANGIINILKEEGYE